MQATNSKRNAGKEALEPTRTTVLTLLWKRIQWLDRQVDNQRLKPTPIQRHRVYMTHTLISGCKTLLYGLKDEELDLRMAAIEEKLENGVLIPNDNLEQKNTRR